MIVNFIGRDVFFTATFQIWFYTGLNFKNLTNKRKLEHK